MARFPVIDSRCPLRWSTMPRAGRDYCTQCQRRVHNLDEMTQTQREAFMATCEEKVCVAYTLPARRRRAVGVGLGLGLVAAVAAAPAAAQDTPLDDEFLETITIIGGTVHPGEARWIDARDAGALPELPTVDADAFLEEPAQPAAFVAPPESG